MFMYNRLLLLLPGTCLLLLLPFNQIIPANLWQMDPYLRRRARVEKTCRDFREQIDRDEKKRARTKHPMDLGVADVQRSSQCSGGVPYPIIHYLF